jgi:hypothetical protein
MRKWYSIQNGERFSRWTVVERGQEFCSCRCDCGYITNVRTNNLLRSKTRQCRSCSITSRNIQISRWEGNLTDYPPKIRMAVKNAILRCTDRDHEQYHRYGGRGIRVHPPWVEDRVAFVEYLMTLDGCNDEFLWLDRIDNDGNYEPGNLRWVTPSVSRVNSHRDD